jgi:hypothetical protein
LLKTDYAIVNAFKDCTFLDTHHWGSVVAVTLNLKQGHRSGATYRTWVRLDEHQCRATFRHFMNRLNRAVFKNAHKRKGRGLRVIMVLEREIDGRWHIHAAIECPAHLIEPDFKTLINNCWSSLDWSYGLHVQPAYDADGWTDYLLKLRQKSGLESWGDAIDLDSTHNPPADAGVLARS